MLSRVGKTTVSMYIAFSQAALNKKQEEEYLKNNPSVDIEEYRATKKSRKSNYDTTAFSEFQA